MDEILARAGIFQGVEPTAVSALTKQLQPVDFPRGHTVFAEGEPGDRLYIIISGKVKIGRRSPDGRENLLTIMGPSDMFGELSIFLDPGPRTSSATTITEVRAVSMDRDALRAWIADRPEIAEQLLRVLASSAPHQQQPGRPDLHGRARSRGQAAAAAGSAVRNPGGRGAASRTTSLAGRDRPARRRVPRDRQQGAGRFRPPRLDPLEGKSVLISDSERLARRAR